MDYFTNKHLSNFSLVPSLHIWRKWRDRPLHDPYAIGLDPRPIPPGPVSSHLARLAAYAYDSSGDAVMNDLQATTQEVNDLAQDVQCLLSLDGEDKCMEVDPDSCLDADGDVHMEDAPPALSASASTRLTLLSESTPSQGGVIVITRSSDMAPIGRAVVTETAIRNPFAPTSTKLTNVLPVQPPQQDTFTASWSHAQSPLPGSEVMLRNGQGEVVGMARVIYAEAPMLSSSARQGSNSGNGGEGFLRNIWNPRNIFLSFMYSPLDSRRPVGEVPQAPASPMIVEPASPRLPSLPCTPIPSTPLRSEVPQAMSLAFTSPPSVPSTLLPSTPSHPEVPVPVQTVQEPLEDPFQFEPTPPATPACSNGELEEEGLKGPTTPIGSPTGYHGVGDVRDEEPEVFGDVQEDAEDREPGVAEERDDMEAFDYEQAKRKDKGKGRAMDNAEVQQDVEEDHNEAVDDSDTSNKDDDAKFTDDDAHPTDSDSDDDGNDNDEAGQGSISQQTQCQSSPIHPTEDTSGPSRGPRNPLSDVTNTVSSNSRSRITNGIRGHTIRFPAAMYRHVCAKEAAKASAESKERVRKMKARAARKVKEAKGKAKEEAREEARSQPSAKALGKRKAVDVDDEEGGEDEDEDNEDSARKYVAFARKKARREEGMAVDQCEEEEGVDSQAQLDGGAVITHLDEVHDTKDEDESNYATVREELDHTQAATEVPATSESSFTAPSFPLKPCPATSRVDSAREFVEGSSRRPLRPMPTRSSLPAPSPVHIASGPTQLPEFEQGSSRKPLEEVAPSMSGPSQGGGRGKRKSTEDDDDDEEDNQHLKRRRWQDVLPPPTQENAMFIDNDSSHSSLSSTTPPAEDYLTESTPPPAPRQSKGKRKAEDTDDEDQEDNPDTSMEIDQLPRPIKKRKASSGASIASSSHRTSSPTNIFGHNREMLSTTHIMPAHSSLRARKLLMKHQGKAFVAVVKEHREEEEEADRKGGEGAKM